MMKKRILPGMLMLIPVFANPVLAQEKPYFQQEVNYKIEVTLDDEKHMLTAKEEIEYVNKSPDTLKVLYFHLWPNGYKNKNTALARQFVRNNSTSFRYADDTSKGWIDQLDFRQNGQTVQWVYDPEHIDICLLKLNTPLPPGGRTRISTPFRVKLPGDFSRLGHVGKSYQISQWYPKPAVYDREGWHAMPYLNQGEFFSEFGSYEVKITLGAMYRVAATGQLQEQEEKDWLKALSEYLNIQEKGERLPADEPRLGKTKTITFKQDRVHDFAWFCSESYVVRKSEISLPSGRKVATWAFFEPRKETPWKKATEYLDEAILHYSRWVGEYPYPAATAVQGALSAGGGMEYPMVTVISAGGSPMMLDNVITHEIGHNWFYGILASNEREHAWMDEGFNSYIEERYMNERYPERTMREEIGVPPVGPFKGLGIHWYSYLSSTIHASYNYQYPINTPSVELPSIQYGLLSYKRTALLLNYLADYLGQQKFDSCMHAYFDTWKFRHPSPADVQKVFEETSGKKLDWFFLTLFNTEKQVEYALTSIHKEGDQYRVKVKNRGQVIAPYPIQLVSEGKVVGTYWFEGHEGSREQSIPYRECDKLVLDRDYHTPDLNLRNNSLKTSGLFKRSEPLQVSLLTGVTQNSKSQLHWFPSLGYNTRDQFMLGLGFHNQDIQGKRFNYLLMPMYSFGDNTLAGNFLLKYDWYLHDRALKKIRLITQYKRFAGYDKVEPSLNFLFRTKGYAIRKHWLSLSYGWISDRTGTMQFPQQYGLSRIRYQQSRKNGLHDEETRISVSYVTDADSLEHLRLELAHSRVDRIGRKDRLVTRFYAGFANKNGGPYFSLYSASSTDIGRDYYLFDRVGNAQFGWVGKQQALRDQGGFTAANLFDGSMLLSANVEYRRKGIFLHPYVHGLVVNSDVYYETGFGLNLGLLNIYLPVASNVYTENNLPTNFENWINSVRFTLSYNFSSLYNQLEIH